MLRICTKTCYRFVTSSPYLTFIIEIGILYANKTILN